MTEELEDPLSLVKLEDAAKWVEELPTPKIMENAIKIKVETDDESDSEQSTENKYEEELNLTSGNIRRLKKNEAENGKFECSFCDITFTKLSVLKEHTLQKHKKKHKFICEICSKSFIQYLFLTRHMINHTVQRPYACKYCGKHLHSLFTLKRHMDLHTIKKTYKCRACREVFDDSLMLKAHMNIHLAAKSYPCDVCNKIYKSAYLLKYHKLIHLKDKPFKCDLCPKAFAQLPTLRRHRFLHTEDSDKTFVCEVCAKRFPASYLLKNHMAVHEEPSDCPVCEKSFLLATSLKIHMNAMHSGNNPYKCKLCQKTFSQPSALGRHLKLHNSTKKYTCDECDKTFHIFGYLKKHIAIVHSRPFKCEICKKSFVHPQKLDDHMLRKHDGEMSTIPLKELRECYICGKSFDRVGSLKRHNITCKQRYFGTKNSNEPQKTEIPTIAVDDKKLIYIHDMSLAGQPIIKIKSERRSNEPYKCVLCEKTLSQASALIRHMKIHTRLTHKCVDCGKAYNRSEHLQLHYSRIHDPNKEYKCDLCKKTFSHAQTLKMHMGIHDAAFQLNTVQYE